MSSLKREKIKNSMHIILKSLRNFIGENPILKQSISYIIKPTS